MNKLQNFFSAAMGITLTFLLLPVFVWLGLAAIGAAIFAATIGTAIAFFHLRTARIS